MNIRNKNAKFIVYLWDQDAIQSYSEDCGGEEGSTDYFYDALEHNQPSISDYGELIGEFMSEDEANRAASDRFEKMSYSSDEIAIWNVEERYWFN